MKQLLIRLLVGVRAIANRVLNLFGLEIGRAGQTGDWDWFFRNVSKLGFTPKLILDIGVAYGTPTLYRLFPDAKFLLFDPAKGSIPFMERIANKFNAEYHNLALGRESGTLVLDERSDLVGSTLFTEVGQAESRDHYEVSVRRLDDVVNRIEDRPCLVKIDVQGAELIVIDGMAGIMDSIDMVIVESSLISTLESAPEIAEIISSLESRGFVIYDLLGFERRPLDRCLAQTDLVFVPKDSALRQDRRWSASS